MSNMVYRHGDSEKWKGIGYDYEIVSDEDLQGYLDNGWFAHPDELLNDIADRETEVKTRKKPGPKPKAAPDESND